MRFLTLILVVVASITAALAQMPSSLFGIPVAWRTAVKEEKVVLNTLISVPRQNGTAVVRMRIPRRDISEEFLRTVLSQATESDPQRASHPLLLPGIELVLRPDILEIAVHDGTILHFRNDVPGVRAFRTFNGREPLATIEAVDGNAYVTTDPAEVAKQFDDIYVAWHGQTFPAGQSWRTLPDGRLELRTPFVSNELVPRRYPPRVEP